MQLRVVWVGKTRNAHLRSLCDDYLERMRHLVPCRVVEVRDVAQGRGLDLRAREGAKIARVLPDGARIVTLDADGKELSSDGFARWLADEQNRGTREIAFVLGGPEGLHEAIRGRADWRFSLGRLTWTHEIARVLLLEQIYRAFTILRGIPYHK